jgi:inosine/xanthosine triphosphatase
MIFMVGSQNKAKLASVEKALEKIGEKRIEFKSSRVIGVVTDSGVRSQPLTEAETLQGAINRATSALEKGCLDSEYGIGIESGLSQVGGHTFEGGFVAIVSRSGKMGFASSNKYELRRPIMNIIDQGKELSEAVEMITELSDIKNTLGMSGVITNGIIDRTESYVNAIVLAFGPFLSDKRLWECDG